MRIKMDDDEIQNLTTYWIFCIWHDDVRRAGAVNFTAAEGYKFVHYNFATSCEVCLHLLF